MALTSLFVVLQQGEEVQADSYGGLSARAWVDANSPNARNGQLCANNRAAPNFTAYITSADIFLGDNNSELEYTMVIEWRQCSKDTNGYAIHSSNYCPLAGYYGGADSPEYRAWDCVKYIEATPFNATDDNPSLGCPVLGLAAPGKRSGHPNRPCTTGEFRTKPLYKPSDRPVNGAPNSNNQVMTFTRRIPINSVDRNTKTSSNGTRSFTRQICQYYWFVGETAANDSHNDCQDLTIYYDWTYTPVWDVVTGTSMAVNGGAYSTATSPSSPYELRLSDVGSPSRANWHHTIVNNGQDRTHVGISWTVYQDPNGTPTDGVHNFWDASGVQHTGVWPAGRASGTGHNDWTQTNFTAVNAGQRICQTIGINPGGSAPGGFAGPELSSPRCVRIHYFSIIPINNGVPDNFVGTPPNVTGRVDAAQHSVVEGNHDAVWSAYKYESRDVMSSGQLGARASSSQGPCGISALQNSSYEYVECQDTTAVNYDGSPASQPISAPFGSFGFTGPYPPGTTFCFVLSVRDPTDSTGDNDRWRHSAATCTTSAKKPTVEFLGSDLRVAGNATAGFYFVDGRINGSRSEYGMFSSGVNSEVLSGTGIRGISEVGRGLTFANTPSIGSYNPLPLTSQAYGYFSSLSGADVASLGSSPASGVYNLTSGSLGSMNVAANRDVIIRRVGTLRITENITVDNNNVRSANRLSQVVVVADNIVIEEDVTRIDAWLITSPSGSINTCEGSGNLYSNMCDSQLTVNGPVYTRSLMLRRTVGSNIVGSPAVLEDLRAPAERFRLRPDAQLWAYTYANKADYAQIDYIEELPPRY